MKPLLAIGFFITVVVAILAHQFQQKKHVSSENKNTTNTMIEKDILNKQQPIVIILNGPSTSGKSSIQKEFQYFMMPNLWIKLGIDNLFDNPMPNITLENIEFWQKENPIRWVSTTKDKEKNSIITLHTGSQGEQVAYGMNKAIVAYAQASCNCIIDYIAYKKEWIDDLQQQLKNANIKTYWIKVTTPLSVLEQREVMRGTSPKGHARSHYDSIYFDLKYDLEIDTSKLNPQECAQKIYELIYKKSS